MGLQKLAGVVVVVGSLFFFVAAFSPISMAFFPESNSARQLEIIMNGRQAWTISHVFFGLGAVVTAVGIGLVAYHLRDLKGSSLAFLGVGAMVVGAVFWLWDVYLRTADPVGFVGGSYPAWHFVAYVFLTLAGLVAVGVVLLRSGVPNWVGWVVVVGSLVFMMAFVVFKDLPPFVFYLLTLLVGVMVYLG
ncbi:MAG: hypothetical protein WAM60_14560 [Candidatus Promineifilaceae bacterium]